jgi:hypothetical protein
MRIAVKYDNFNYKVSIQLTDDDGTQSSFYTKVKILPNQWDNLTKRVKTTHPDFERLNNLIIEKYRLIEEVATENPEIRKANAFHTVKRMQKDKIKYKTLNEMMDAHIINTWDHSSKRYIDTMKFLRTLAKFNPEIFFNSITRLMVFDFDKWMVKQKYADSTIMAYHHLLKMFIDVACRKGYVSLEDNPYTGDLKFHYQSDTNNAVFLEDYEIRLIYDLNLHTNKKIIRDYFVISCYTGLDFSTISTLKQNSFYERGTHRFIRIQRVKTKTNCIIPVHPIVDEIIKSYNYSMPRIPVKVAYYNRVVKLLGKEAGLNQLLSVTIKREEKLVPKWTLLASHTGRRSAATNMFLAGIKPIQIRMITGHRTEESFIKYIRITKQTNAEMVAENKYFQDDKKSMVSSMVLESDTQD